MMEMPRRKNTDLLLAALVYSLDGVTEDYDFST